MSKKIIRTKDAPAPVGPYSQAVVLDGWIWTSGQVALDPASGVMIGSDVSEQADRVLKNIKAVLQSAGSSLDRVVRVTVYLKSMEDFSAVNKVYLRYFPDEFPARSSVEVSRLPLGALVEIDAVARVARPQETE
jgi:2-iminobutanoate/2-iminopropanoate deaminase